MKKKGVTQESRRIWWHNPILTFILSTQRFFSNFSTLHGSFHLSKRSKSTFFDRALWSSLMIVAGCGVLYISSIYIWRYFERPLVMTMERDFHNWNTTFPGFTICSQNTINETAMRQYLSERNSSVADIMKFELFIRNLVTLKFYNFSGIYQINDLPPSEYLRVIDRLSNHFDYNVHIGSMPSIKLKRTITELGICDTFNSKISPYFDPDFIINNRLPANEPLIEINYHDVDVAILLPDLDDSFVYIHGPYDMPQYACAYEIKRTGESSMFRSFTMTATTILARSNVRNMSPERRKCRYFDESNLSRFPVYSYDLCKLECKINHIVQRVGCIPFFYKKLPHEEHCNHLQSLRISQAIKEERAIQSCKCPVACENVKFGRRDSETVYWIKNNTFRLELTKPKMRVLRDNLYSMTDIMIAVGATSCLFLGTSVLTLAEFIYFASIRVFLRR